MDYQINSWRNFKAVQQPNYQDTVLLQKVESELGTLPPLIFAGEVRSLKAKLTKAGRGEAFLLQAGDCAESFLNNGANNIKNMFKAILQMAIVLSYSSGLPVIKIGRVAGQFAKPRSSDFEELDGVSLPSYRGDIVNGFEFNEKARVPNPKRMLQAYYQSAATLNLLRAFSNGGFADLNEIHKYNLDFVNNNELKNRYDDLIQNLSQALNFMKAYGIDSASAPIITKTEFYTSHEALLLNYEEALTRIDSLTGELYNCSAHMLWIGERTRQVDGAHIEFLRGIKNPIGIKISDKATSSEILKLYDRLNPTNEEGKINIIFRVGADKIEGFLPKILKELNSEGKHIIYSSDPMHANTIKSSNNYKTREFDKIISELKQFLAICKDQNVHAGGVHLEMTGDNVTECIGGAFNLKESDLLHRYETQCDPRLNANQAIELAFLIADELKLK